MDELKEAFTTYPVLRIFDWGKPARLEADASEHAAAAILMQPHPWRTDPKRIEWHPVAYWSFKFDKAQRNYPIPDKEMLALASQIYCIQHLEDMDPGNWKRSFQETSCSTKQLYMVTNIGLNMGPVDVKLN